MALANNEVWANGNPPPISIEDASTQAQNDVGQGINCGQPINPDGINFALHKYSSCLKGELENFVALSSVPYDPDNPTNLADAFQDIFCSWLSDFFFFQTVSGTGSVSITLPPGGSWCVSAVMNGAAGHQTGVAGGDFSNAIREDDPDDDINYASSFTAIRAGGTTITLTQPGDGRAIVSVKAFNLDCPI